MKNLTTEEKIEIAMEMIKDEPMQTIGHMALLKLGQMAISTNSESATLSTEATIEGQRYKMDMVITYTKI